EARHIAILQPKRAPMTKESDHSANLSKAREMLLVERRQLAAELTKSYQRGDGEKRERFMVVQSMIEAIDRAALDEARIARGEDPLPAATHYATENPNQIQGKKTLPPRRFPPRVLRHRKKGLGAKLWF